IDDGLAAGRRLEHFAFRPEIVGQGAHRAFLVSRLRRAVVDAPVADEFLEEVYGRVVGHVEDGSRAHASLTPPPAVRGRRGSRVDRSAKAWWSSVGGPAPPRR